MPNLINNGETNFTNPPCAHVENYAAQGRLEIHLPNLKMRFGISSQNNICSYYVYRKIQLEF
jgi:hypothetical protein